MITPTMRKFLEDVDKHPEKLKEIKTCVYMNRIQKRIEKEMDATLWLAVHYPNILLDEEREYTDASGKIVCHRRLKKLILIVKAVNPKMEVDLVLKNIEFPEKELPVPNASIDDLYRAKGKCPKCGLPIDLCTCKEEEKEQEREKIIKESKPSSERTTVMPRPN
jgi:hypothetical protein